jgi:hypothetical protein
VSERKIPEIENQMMIIQKTSVFLTGDKDEIRLVGAGINNGQRMSALLAPALDPSQVASAP